MKDYGMLSDEGNAALHCFLENLIASIEPGDPAKDIYRKIRIGFDEIAQSHKEVWNMSVREQFIASLERFIDRSLTIYF